MSAVIDSIIRYAFFLSLAATLLFSLLIMISLVVELIIDAALSRAELHLAKAILNKHGSEVIDAR